MTHGAHTTITNKSRIYKRGYKMNLSASERAARSQRMREMRRAAITAALGETNND